MFLETVFALGGLVFFFFFFFLLEAAADHSKLALKPQPESHGHGNLQTPHPPLCWPLGVSRGYQAEALPDLCVSLSPQAIHARGTVFARWTPQMSVCRLPVNTVKTLGTGVGKCALRLVRWMRQIKGQVKVGSERCK